MSTQAGMVMRPQYRELSVTEKRQVYDVKALGEHFHGFIDGLERNSGEGARELSIAKTRVEEAVMWAVKAITG